jgi:nucleoid-associated protein YgaU
MTADAKIGLLLGLVFIVIIAFLINGLPNFFKSEENSEQLAFDVPTPAVTPNVLIPSTFNNNNTAYANGPLRPSTPSTEVDSTAIPPIASDEKPDVPAEPVILVSKNRTYTVRSGDSLAAIAKKHYGAEVGNRMAAIKQIAKANNLELEDIIGIGDVLKIPSLSNGNQKPKKKSITPATMIARGVEKLTDALKKKKTVEYIVKSGDCLSMISADQLGTCKRIDEILKLNKEIIDDADDIVKGMVIKLPQS